jgi:hypothetical protein
MNEMEVQAHAHQEPVTQADVHEAPTTDLSIDPSADAGQDVFPSGRLVRTPGEGVWFV